uniref:Uncharacterized protein n=1 Tax=Strombidium rassoulzadegani TaxID=1082188 RepID=A0A7S3CS02_9SPIT|mmetsp:Transcript_5447/g.9200  ORF Transcript_5447/g.9200 Transcript_5447/m.9200 type:complete len:190 (+) Transcript_5447:1839-2408(+)
MGIPENPAKHALYRTGNNNADVAVTWYFENMDDASLALPLRVPKAKNAAGAGQDLVDPEKVGMMTGMGLPEKKCIKALKSCDMNLERAMDWVFSHMDDNDDDEPEDSVMEEASNADVYKCAKPGFYKLQSFITHLGSSVHAGHYVCHIKKPVDPADPSNEQWVYYNDAKVALTDQAPFGKGYIYVLQKI